MKLTPEVQAAIIEGLDLGMSRTAAAVSAGVSASMFASWAARASKATRGKAVDLFVAIVAAEARIAREAYADLTGLSRVEFCEHQLRAVTRQRARAGEAGSNQAFATLSRQVVEARDALDESMADGTPELDEMEEVAFLQLLADRADKWPESYYQVLFGRYRVRHRCRLVIEHDGGKAVG